ncbi:MAG: radical SAM protein [bacterium]|nr:radical SAM protein [bacterium]
MKNRNVLLINPWIYDFAAYDLWVKPLGLLYLASVLRKNGYTLTYLDLLDDALLRANRTELKKREFGQKKFHKEIVPKPAVYRHIPRRYGRYGVSEESFLARLHQIPKPNVVLVTSMMTYWYPGVFRAIELLKQTYPDVPVILGGIYATLGYDHASHYSRADYLIAGEGEIQGIKLVDKLTGNQSSFFPNPTGLDSYPYPAFDLVRNLNYVCILTTRGCPYRCTYCASHLISPGFQRREPEKVVAEIEYWHQNYGLNNFVFYDDALTVEPESHLIPLLKMIIVKKWGLTFHTPNGMHSRGITAEVARLMFQVGFKTIRLGLESCDPEFQSSSGGKITNPGFQQAITHLHNAGYTADQIGVYLLTGLPNQHADEVEASIRFVQSCGARPYLSEYTPIPGTVLWEQAVAASPFDIASDPLWHNNSIFPCQWDGFTWEELRKLKLLLHK